jgi:hypothetical protein
LENENVKAKVVEKKDLDVPVFVFDDFVKTVKPFEYVAAARDDDFEFMQRQELVCRMANACKLRNFKSLMKNYMKKNYPKTRSVYVNTTEFTGQPMELSCGSYFCDDGGISIQGDRDFDIEVCNHPIIPVQRLVNIDDNTEKLKLSYRKGAQWREIVVDKETLASSNKILSLAKYGVAVNSENSKHLVKYFTDIENLNFDVLPELNSVGRLGWIGNRDFSPYVEDLVFDGSENFRSFFKSVTIQGNYHKWLELVKAIRKEKNSKFARILLAASFASVLVEICDCLPFFVHLWGGTEAGKTVGLMLAASVWASPAMGDYIHTFNSTNVAQELSATFVNSLPLIIDELQIVKNNKNMDNIVYLLAEGVGRARGQKTGGLQKIGTWRNCIITNGEFPISNNATGGGAVNRIIEINCDDSKLFNDPVNVVDVIKRNFGSAGRLFIEYLQLDGEKDKIIRRQKEIFKTLISDSEITEKQASSARLILLADEIAEKIIFEDGIRLSKEDIEPFLSTRNQVDQNGRCLEFIYDYVAVNQYRFVPSSNGEYIGEVWGKVEDGYIFIIKTIFDKAVNDAGYNSTAFLSWAKQRGLIETSKGRNSVLRRVQGNPCRCVALISQELSETPVDDNTIDEDLPF